MRNTLKFSLLILATLMLPGCRNTPTEASVQAEFMQFCAQFSDCSYVNWTRINNIDTQQYSADWCQNDQHLMDSTGFPAEIAAAYWQRLMNAKTLLHKRSLPFRSFNDTHVNDAVDCLEQGFHEVFTRMIRQEYYLRIFEDCFDEVIPPLVDSLVLREHLGNKE